MVIYNSSPNILKKKPLDLDPLMHREVASTKRLSKCALIFKLLSVEKVKVRVLCAGLIQFYFVNVRQLTILFMIRKIKINDFYRTLQTFSKATAKPRIGIV